jgi:hypothetical protein
VKSLVVSDPAAEVRPVLKEVELLFLIVIGESGGLLSSVAALGRASCGVGTGSSAGGLAVGDGSSALSSCVASGGCSASGSCTSSGSSSRGGTCSGSSSRSGASHLHRNTATEGTSTSGVLATDHADVALSSNSAGASLGSVDLDVKRLVLQLGVGVAATVVTLEVLGDSHRNPVGTGTSGVDHALVRTSTVGVDLVNGHHERTASGDLRKSGAVELHDLSGTGLDVVVTSTEGLTANSCGITTEASGVLLEGVAVCSVTRSGGIDTDGRASTAGITSSLDDGTVASHESRGGQKAEGNNGGLGEVHFEYEDSLNRSGRRIRRTE